VAESGKKWLKFMVVATHYEFSAMFQGSPHINLDAKGRLAVPSRFRAEILETSSGGLTVTRHPDGCLLIYPSVVWERKREELMRLPYALRAFQRLVMGSAEDLVMDASGRIQIPVDLRSAAGLKKEVVLVGLGDHFELWDAELLARSEAELFAGDVAATLESFNF
jgi:MraZ protein